MHRRDGVACQGCGLWYETPGLPDWSGKPRLVVCFACEPPTSWCEACIKDHPEQAL
jgi:hypothetical protein